MIAKPTRRTVLGGLAALALPSSMATATPAGPVILTVSGKVRPTDGVSSVTFDLAGLDALPQRVTETATPWHEGHPLFAGPLGSGLLTHVGANGSRMRLTALNDYTVEIPVADFQDWPVILATRIDGKPMAVRDKGPIFVIYPFDQQPNLKNELYFGRSIWQLKAIEIL